jgi:RimJ/RimL family protein N-acetyltransferase
MERGRIEAMLEAQLQFIPLNLLTTKQHAQLLSIRNLESIRDMMSDTKEIVLKEHLAWVDKHACNPKQCYYALKNEGQIIGGINCTDIIASECSWGIYIEPNIEAGLTSFVTYLFLKHLFEEKQMELIWAKVKLINFGALRFNESFGFTCKREDKEFYYLELTKQAWQERSSSRLFQTLMKRYKNITYQFMENS